MLSMRHNCITCVLKHSLLCYLTVSTPSGANRLLLLLCSGSWHLHQLIVQSVDGPLANRLTSLSYATLQVLLQLTRRQLT